MNWVRKIALGVLSPLFVVLLFATALDFGFIHTATNPGTVKRLIAESGVYNSAVPNVLQQTKTIETNIGNFSTSDPIIQSAAKSAVTPQYVRQNTEAAIDNIYQWLDGKIAEPNFKIDLNGVKNSFADKVAASVQQRLSGLPACTAAQNLAIAKAGTYNALEASCLPKGLTPAIAANQAKNAVLNNQDFLKDTSISASDIRTQPICNTGDFQCTPSDKGSSIFAKNNNIPKQYQRAKKTPVILAVLTILAGAGIVFLSRTRQYGLRHIGISLLVIGVIMLIFAWVLNRATVTKIAPKIKVDNALLQQDVRALVKDIAQQIDKNYWWFGGVYTLIGAGSITAAEIFRRRAQPAPVHNQSAPTSEGTHTSPDKPAKL